MTWHMPFIVTLLAGMQLAFVLAAAASKIALDENVPDWEKKDARTVTAIMSAKSRLGLGVGTAKQRKARWRSNKRQR